MGILRSVVLLGLVLGQSAFSSDIIGNGGDAIVCPNSVEMLDLYEGRTVRGLAFDPTLLGANELETVQNILNRLQGLDPIRARKYREWADAFVGEARLVSDADLTDIPDSQHLAVPTGCKIEQVAIQVEPKFAQDPRYIISEKIWLRMDLASRAALILHEIIYREAILWGQKNSIDSRYLNSYISSSQFVTLPKAAYLDATSRTKFFLYIPVNVEWEGRPVFISTLKDGYNDCGNVFMNSDPSKEMQMLVYGGSSSPQMLIPFMSTVRTEWFPSETKLPVGANFRTDDYGGRKKWVLEFLDNQISGREAVNSIGTLQLCVEWTR